MKAHKNYLLLSLIIISQIHVFFRGLGISVDWFLLVDKQRGLNFTVFMIGVFVRFIILHYCLLRPYGINKDLKIYLLILSTLDLLHFFLTSGLGYAIEKILVSLFILGIVKFIRYVKFNYSII